MPVPFDKCAASGGRVRTKRLSAGKYLHNSFKGRKSFAGEIKKKKA